MEYLVSDLVEQLSSILLREIDQEARIVVGVEKEVKNLTRHLRAIRSELPDAERNHIRDYDVNVRRWLERLKNFCYETDDVLGEWSTEILKSQILPDQRKKVRFFTLSSCFPGGLVGTRPDIASKIRELNKRVECIADDVSKFHLARTIEQIPRIATRSLVDESEVIGRETEKYAIISMLMGESSREPSLSVISIVGLGGIGKTTLAQLVFNDCNIKRYFEVRIWVCVSNDFDEIRVANQIIQSHTATSSDLLQNPFQKIRQLIASRRFLLVLDDVWEEDSKSWENLISSLKSGSPGSKILVTTHNEHAANIMGCTNVFQLGQLSFDDCWSIFTRYAFDETNEVLDDLVDIGKKIVVKFSGFPSVVKTLGLLLRGRGSIWEWQRVLNSERWELERVGEDIFEFFTYPLSKFHNLPSNVKPCLSYCALFPNDYMLEKDKLVNLWMAEGFIKASQVKEMELIGQEYLEILAECSFFHDFRRDKHGSIIMCKMHVMAHDFARFLSKKDTLCMEVNDTNELLVNSDREVHHLAIKFAMKDSFPVSVYCLTVNDTDELLVNSDTEVQHLAIKFAMEGSSPVSVYCSTKLRTLFLESESDSILEINLASLFNKLTCLRTLKLSRISITEIPDEIKKLIHLRHLDLSNNPSLQTLAEAICELFNLQTLDLSGCWKLEKLPCGICKLVNLRCLKNRETMMVTFMPRGIERLSSLRTLDEFVVNSGADDDKASTLGDLKNLNQLRKCLEIRGLRNARDVGEAQKAQLKKKKHLTTLILNFDGPEVEGGVACDDGVIEALEPPPGLECLEINDYKGTTMLPSWMMSLAKLWKVCLSNFMNCASLPPLGKLSSLEYLEVKCMNCVKKVGLEFLGEEIGAIASSSVAFPQLKELRISCMKEWEEWEEWNHGPRRTTVMPCLLLLDIQFCPKLKVLPIHLLPRTAKLNTHECLLLERPDILGETSRSAQDFSY